MREFIKDMLTDDRTKSPSSTRVAGFIALFALIFFCAAILIIFLIKGTVGGLEFIAWSLVSVVVSLFLGKVVKDFSKPNQTYNEEEIIG